MYVGSLLINSSLTYIATENLLLSFVVFLLTKSFLIDRIDREEQILFDKFGDQYINYCRKTKRFITLWH